MNGERDSQAQRIAQVARDLQDHRNDRISTYELAVKVAQANVDGCDAAALSIVRGRQGIETVAATDDLAVAADQLQYDLGEGPCLDQLWRERHVYTPDLRHEDRWPEWSRRAVEETAVRSVLALHVFTHQGSLGVLNLYSRSVDGIDADDREEAAAIAAHVAIAVASVHEINHLTLGLDSRTVIGQATGILMGRFRLDADAAFKVLARYSSSSELKLRDVAAEIVRTGVLPRTGTRTGDTRQRQG
jgi:GAF domain-containing protein